MTLTAATLTLPALVPLIPLYLLRQQIPPLVTMVFGCAVPATLLGFLVFSGLF